MWMILSKLSVKESCSGNVDNWCVCVRMCVCVCASTCTTAQLVSYRKLGSILRQNFSKLLNSSVFLSQGNDKLSWEEEDKGKSSL